MSKVGKNAISGGNIHLKPIPEENKAAPKGRQEAQEKSIWNKKIGSKGKMKAPAVIKNRVACLKGKESLRELFVALNILFPESCFGKLMKVKSLPNETPHEKAEKENAFKKLLLEQFDIHEVKRDMNCALRAIICGLNPDLENNAEEITAYILRGDLIDYIKKHPEYIEGGNDPEVLQHYCGAMTSGDLPVGIKEMRIISDLLETPIHIFRSDNALVDQEQKICSGKESTFGTSSHRSKKPISIYYDPDKGQFMPLFPKKQSKFGILKLG